MKEPDIRILEKILSEIDYLEVFTPAKKLHRVLEVTE